MGKRDLSEIRAGGYCAAKEPAQTNIGNKMKRALSAAAFALTMAFASPSQAGPIDPIDSALTFLSFTITSEGTVGATYTMFPGVNAVPGDDSRSFGGTVSANATVSNTQQLLSQTSDASWIARYRVNDPNRLFELDISYAINASAYSTYGDGVGTARARIGMEGIQDLQSAANFEERCWTPAQGLSCMAGSGDGDSRQYLFYSLPGSIITVVGRVGSTGQVFLYDHASLAGGAGSATDSWSLSVVPEPPTIALFFVGLLGLLVGTLGWRRTSANRLFQR